MKDANIANRSTEVHCFAAFLMIALLALSAPRHVLVGQQTPSKCLQIIDRSFQRVNTEKLIAYEVNIDYLLRAEFQKKW